MSSLFGKGESWDIFRHLMASLRFAIDPDLLTILEYYDLPLGRYFPTSIGAR